MSHQGHEGWFPECLICGYGNVGAIVCLSPMCHEQSQGKVVDNPKENLIEKDGHFWKLCNHCEHPSLSDSASWGTYAICVECWNKFAKKNELPPNSPKKF